MPLQAFVGGSNLSESNKVSSPDYISNVAVKKTDGSVPRRDLRRLHQLEEQKPGEGDPRPRVRVDALREARPATHAI
jgi:hypothetical protein